ncbi:MAG: sigma-70 family RNA polymerase sigma factor [Phycisphaerae bacterium]|nr:sigma-70 family RNA polymerase sigma factor [Phycisphaerae bacterium]
MALLKHEHEALVAKAVAGDADALTELLAAYGPRVERHLDIGRRWRGVLDTADVMQVTYLEAFLEIARFDAARATTFAAWLHRLAENNLRDALRGLARHKRQPAARRVLADARAPDDSRDQLLDELVSASSTPSRALRREEAHARLDRAISQLPDDYAAVVRASDLQGLDPDAVAALLQRSPGAVHMLRARAHQRLSELLDSAASM